MSVQMDDTVKRMFLSNFHIVCVKEISITKEGGANPIAV